MNAPTPASRPTFRQSLSHGTSREQVYQAMGGNQTRLRELWDREFDPLIELIAWAGLPRADRLEEIDEALGADPKAPTLMLVPQRNNDDRTCRTAATIAEMCAAHATPFHALFGGGNYYTGEMAEFGEEPAPVLAQRFLALAPPDCRNRYSIDQMSLHTGHLGRYIGQVIRTFGYRRVIAVVPRVHVVRFMATYTHDLLENGGAHDVAQFGVAIGEWDDMQTRRLTHAEEAFCPVLTADDPRFISAKKLIGDELGVRLHEEVARKPGRFCWAAAPSEMCRLIGIPL